MSHARLDLLLMAFFLLALAGCNRPRLHGLNPPPGSTGDAGDAAGAGDPGMAGDPTTNGDAVVGDPGPGDPGTTGDSSAGDPGNGGDAVAGDPGSAGDPTGPGDPAGPGDPTSAGDPVPGGDPGAAPTCCTGSGCTPARGSYIYSRQPVGSLGHSIAVQFHPDGTYAVVLEQSGGIHLFDWAAEAATRFEPDASIYWSDVAFTADGSTALLVGWDSGAADEGVVYSLDDAGWRRYRGGDTTAVVLTRLTNATQINPIQAVEFPWGSSGNPVLLSRPASSPYYATLREFDIATGTYVGLLSGQSTGAGADDLMIANNEFGEPGIFVACGVNGADTQYYTEVGGAGEWRADPGNNNLGNTSRVAAHCSGDYGLVVSWSGRALYRFEAGSLNAYGDAPRFSTQGIWDVSFQQDGRRALVVGRASGSPLRGTVIEYRHGAYLCPTPYSDCDLTDVSIPDFEAAPYLGTGNTYLHDTAFRPGCDGGLIVGGESDWQTDRGLLIEFAIQGGVACR